MGNRSSKPKKERRRLRKGLSRSDSAKGATTGEPKEEREERKEERKADLPKEEPKADAPKEEPKTDPPKEEPKADPPKEEPKADPPKEEPKADPPSEEPSPSKSYPASVPELRAQSATPLSEGEHVLYFRGNPQRPFTVFVPADGEPEHCYLSLHHENYSTTSRTKGKGQKRVFQKVRLDPLSLLVNITDRRFSQASEPAAVNYASCGDCGGAGSHTGRAVVDLRDTPFRVASAFCHRGWRSEGCWGFEHDDQVVRIQGGGWAGSASPLPPTEDGTERSDGFALQLAFVQDTSDVYELALAKTNESITAMPLDRARWDATASLSVQASATSSTDDVLAANGLCQTAGRLTERRLAIFLSSTFSDWAPEREVLHRSCFAKVRSLAKTLDPPFDVDVVDARWGIPEQASNDHRTATICLTEAARCARLSAGVPMIVMIGDKLGWRPLPPVIPRDDFDALIAVLDASVADMARAWYHLDENISPPAHVLLPVGDPRSPIEAPSASDAAAAQSGLPPSAHQVDPTAFANWSGVEQTLGEGLQRAAMDAALGADRAARYTHSITFQEYEEARAAGGRDIIAVTRQLSNVSFDTHPTFVDPPQVAGASTVLTTFRQSVLEAVDTAKHAHFVLDGAQTNATEDEQYLADLDAKLADMLTAALHEASANLWNPPPVVREVIDHARFAVRTASSFIGRDELLAGVGSYLGAPQREPLVLVGGSGSGKTALMARSACRARAAFPDAVVVFRFLGTTPASSTARQLLVSIAQQLQPLADPEHPDPVLPPVYGDLVTAVHSIMVAVARKQPLLVFLDSLDQLSDDDRARETLNFLPRLLHHNLWLVVSTLPDVGRCMDALSLVYPSHRALQVELLSQATSRRFVELYLEREGRSITTEQMDAIAAAAGEAASPVFLRLLVGVASRLRSFDPPPTGLPTNVRSAIDAFFADLELEFGAVLVAHFVRYVLVAKGGVTESELLDLLSCDEAVLAEVLDAQFMRYGHRSAVRRVPPSVFLRLRGELQQQLVNREARGGVAVLTFYHRQWWEAAQRRYLDGDAKAVRATAAHIAAYYSNDRQGDAAFAGRGLMEQPLWMGPSRPNLRHVQVVSQALIDAGDTAMFAKRVCRVDFVGAKFRAGLGNELLSELLEAWEDEESAQEDRLRIRQFLRWLLHDVNTLSQHPELVYQEAFNEPKDGAVHRDAVEHAEMLPRDHISIVSDPEPTASKVMMLLRGHHGGINAVAFAPSGDLVLTASADRTLRLWNLQSGAELRVYQGHAPHSVMACSFAPNGRLIASGAADGTVIVWDLSSGTVVQRVRLHAFSVEGVAFTRDSQRLVTGSKDQTGLVLDMDGKCLAKLEGHTGFVTAVATSDSVAVTVSADETARVWSLDTYACVRTVQLKGFLTSVDMSADGTEFVVGSRNGQATVVTTDSGATATTFTTKSHNDGEWVQDVTIVPSSPFVVSGSVDYSISVWSRASGKIHDRLYPAHSGFVTAVAALPDPGASRFARIAGGAGVVVSGCSSGELVVWRIGGTAGGDQGWLDRRTSFRGFYEAHFSLDDGKFLGTSSSDCRWYLFSTTDPTATPSCQQLHRFPVHCCGWVGPRTFLSVSRDKTIGIWQVHDDLSKKPTLLKKVEGLAGWPYQVTATPDRTRFMVTTTEGPLTIRDAATGEVVGTYPAKAGNPRFDFVSDDEIVRVSTSELDRCRLADKEASGIVWTAPMVGDDVFVTVVAIPEHDLCVASCRNSVRLFRLADGAPVGVPLEVRGAHFTRPAVACDKNKVYVSSRRGCKIFEIALGGSEVKTRVVFVGDAYLTAIDCHPTDASLLAATQSVGNVCFFLRINTTGKN